MKAKKKVCYRCGNEKFIWKNDGGNKYCKSCWQYVNSKTNSIKQSKPSAKAYKPIAPRSAKRAKQEREYLKLRTEFLNEHSLCQAKLPGICTVHSTDVHHMKGRIGSLLTDVDNFLSVCRSCHNWIELHPIEAKELGFSKNR